MKKSFSSAAIFFILAVSGIGQTAVPTPRPTPIEDDVVKISTSLIQLDVSVTDGKGKVLTDIKPDEIEIFEDGRKQKITNFSFVSSVRTTSVPVASADKTAVPIPKAVLRAENIRRTIALVVDDLSLSFESAYQTRRSLKKFVDEQMQDGDLVAIIRTGAGIGALQQFTSDKRVLYAAIEKVKWNPQGSGGISAFAPIESTPDTSMQTTGDDEEAPEVASTNGQSVDDFRASVFATGTLGALRYIVSGMSELPGRKSVILFSDGFKLLETDANGISEGGRVLDFLKTLVDLATRSSVVFYTIDARGLQTTGFTAADSISDTSPDAMNRASSARRDQLLDTQAGLSFLAEETGGLAIKNNNDLSGGVRKILEDQSYYLIAYEPESDTFDEKRKFNKIEVKVSRKGANVRYRSGFFNVPDKVAVKTPVAMAPAMQLQMALTSPFGVSGIELRLNTLFGYDEKTGSFVRSLVHVNVKDLKFTDAGDGKQKAVFDVLAVSFGDNGQPVETISKSYTLTIPPETMKKLLDNGFVYHFTFPVKKPGAYQYRIAVRDSQGSKVGSASQFIEVPNLKKNRLTASSIVLDSVSASDWEVLSAPNGGNVATDPMSDTALRKFKVGTILRYGYEIYNAKLNSAGAASITTRIRVFHDGRLILDGKPTPINMSGQKNVARINANGAVSIGKQMEAGDYILQIVVIDALAKEKGRIATQFVQFEVE